MEYEQIEAMVAVLKESTRVTELEVRSGDTIVRLRRPPPPRPKKSERQAREKSSAASGTATATSSAATAAETAGVPKHTLVTAQLVGVFRALRTTPVAPGDSVRAEQTIGAIEALRLQNDVKSPIVGTVGSVLVQDGQPVEYGQPLFEILPEEVS